MPEKRNARIALNHGQRIFEFKIYNIDKQVPHHTDRSLRRVRACMCGIISLDARYRLRVAPGIVEVIAFPSIDLLGRCNNNNK